MKQINSAITTTPKEQPSKTGTQLGEYGLATPESFPAALGAVSPTPLHHNSLSPQQLASHREKISFNVRVVLSAYFQPNESEQIKAAQLSWWADELQEWTLEQVVWGLRQWNRKNHGVRPTPGHISSLLKKARGKKATGQGSDREMMEAAAANIKTGKPFLCPYSPAQGRSLIEAGLVTKEECERVNVFV